MLTRTNIRNAATNTTVYSRGLQLYQGGRISSFQVEETNGEEEKERNIEATVKGSGRNVYGVEMTHNLESDRVNGIYCECPAFRKYSGLCKHCVAVLLHYIEWDKMQGTALGAMLRAGAQQKMGPGRPARGRVKPQALTTPGLKALLEKRQEKGTLAITSGEQLGTVRLVPYFHFNASGATLEFRIGAGSMYILKDVVSFLGAMEKEKTVSYGKKLSFLHCREMFDPESLVWVDFIREWLWNHYSSYLRAVGYQMPSKLRNISLTATEMEQFMELVKDGSFFGAKDNDEYTEWRITQEPLKRKLWLNGKADGVELKLEPVFGLKGNRYDYYFLEGRVYPVSRESLAPVSDFMEWMRSIPDRRAFIQKEDVPLFCRQLLPALEKQFVCERKKFDEADYGLAPAAFSFYLDAPNREMVTCRPLVRYGEWEYPLFDEKKDVGRRDQLKETEVRQLVSSFCDAYDEKTQAMAAVGDDAIYEFLTEAPTRLQMVGEVYISEALKRFQVSPTPKVSVGISVSGDLLELRMTAGDMSRAELLEILSRYNRKKKFYRLKNGDFVDISGADVGALAELREGLNLTDAQMKRESVELPRYRALYLDSELREHGGMSVSRNREFRALVRNMKTVEDNDFEIPPSLDPILREYQKVGFLWIKTLKHNGFGGILADDMGLGKTLQVIAFLASEAPSMALIVSPASLVYNWNSEFARFAPELPVTMVVGTAAKRRELIEGAQKGDILLTSYDLLKRDLAHYEQLRFDTEVIDEAQFIKNHGTQAAKAVKQVQAGFRLALTGTPVENRLSELWSIFDYLMPGFLYAYPQFRDEIEEPIVSRQSETATKRLRKMIRPFVLRRLKKDVLTDLPPKIERDFYAKMEGEQQKLYDAHVKRLQILLDGQTDEEFKTSKIQMLAELTRLRQLCCDPALVFEDYRGESAKLEMCLELVRNAVGSGHKILLFSQFTTMLARIEERLDAEKISYYALTGSTKKEERIRLVEDFNRDDTSVFCISLKAGGTGLNLTAADIVIHYDPWWNLAVQNQATDRAHRIGQEQVVTVYKLLTKGTIEENITKIQERKTELAEEILGGEGLKSATFSREELMELLRN